MVSLNNLSQPVFGAAVAAIGVGVQLLHQGLVAGLDLAAGLVAVKVEGGEGAALQIAQRPALGSPFGLAWAVPPPKMPKGSAKAADQVKRVSRPAASLARLTPMFQVGRWPVAAERW